MRSNVPIPAKKRTNWHRKSCLLLSVNCPDFGTKADLNPGFGGLRTMYQKASGVSWENSARCIPMTPLKLCPMRMHISMNRKNSTIP